MEAQQTMETPFHRILFAKLNSLASFSPVLNDTLEKTSKYFLTLSSEVFCHDEDLKILRVFIVLCTQYVGVFL
jgi:hypothetical protein